MKKFKQGIFLPINKQKYKGTLPIFYRSALELKVFRKLDNNPLIISWGSETVIVPYFSPIDKKIHRYYVDLNITILNNNRYERYLIEIKPHAHTIAPTFSKRKKQQTMLYEQAMYCINQAKWAAAKEWAMKHNYNNFIIYTEKHLKG